MKTFQYKITDACGIHARPAGMLAKEAGRFVSRITLECKGKKAEAAKLMAVLRLGVTQNTEVTVSVEGADEEEAASAMEEFFRKNL